MGGSRVKWDDTSEDILIQGLEKATTDARTGDNNFQPSVYQTISEDLLKHGYEIDAGKVKAQWGRLKTARNNIAHLRGLSGFGWDDGRKVVVATEEVWKTVLYDAKGQRVKKFSEYNVWRNKAFPLFQRVTQLIGGNQAVGDNAFSSQKGSAATPSTSAPSTSGPSAATAPAHPATPVSTTPTHSNEDGDNLDSTQASGAPRSISLTQLNSALDHGAIDDSDTAPAAQDGPTTPRSASQAKRPSLPPMTPVSNKRMKAANMQGQLNMLCSSVVKLVDTMVGDATTPSHTSSFSPIRKKAWDRVIEVEGLSPLSLSHARRVFCKDDCVKEYLSFKDDDDQALARAYWLQDEIEAANK